ncbi:MAG: hypothetical protein ACRYG8_03175 [Janthinobacterium lividum]
MKIIAACALTFCLIFTTPGLSAILIATRSGVMCSSPDALAKLTMPDGSSRSSSANARPEDLSAKQTGGCIEFEPGTQVTVVTSRKNTSFVTYDLGDGRGLQQFIVPNIDFSSAGGSPPAPSSHVPHWPDDDYPPLVGMNKLLTAVTKQCPQQGWTGHKLAETEIGPWYDTVKPTPAQNAAIERAEAGCEGIAGIACSTYTRFGVEVQVGYLPQLLKTICSEKAPAE